MKRKIEIIPSAFRYDFDNRPDPGRKDILVDGEKWGEVHMARAISSAKKAAA